MDISLSQALKAIRESDKSRSRLIKEIFQNTKLKGLIFKYVMDLSGDINDSQLIFDEMIVQFVKTMFAKMAIDQDGPLEPYLFTIAKYQWSAELKRRAKIKTNDQSIISNEGDHQSSHEVIFLTEERRHVLLTLLDQLRTNCRDVLMHWANGFSMVEIATKMNYLSEGMARKKKSQCFKELLDYLAVHPHLKDQLAYD